MVGVGEGVGHLVGGIEVVLASGHVLHLPVVVLVVGLFEPVLAHVVLGLAVDHVQVLVVVVLLVGLVG